MTATKTTSSASLAGQSELIKIVVHPLRIRCLIAMAERETSTTKLAHELGVNVGTLWAHVRRLEEAGLIEEVHSESVRGSREYFYKAVQRPLTTDEETAEMTPQDRLKWAERVVQMIMADAAYAIEEGTFAERPDHNAIRFPAHLDQQGWEDVTNVYTEAFEKALEIEAESTGRMINSGEASIPVRIMSMVFEMPKR